MRSFLCLLAYRRQLISVADEEGSLRLVATNLGGAAVVSKQTRRFSHFRYRQKEVGTWSILS